MAYSFTTSGATPHLPQGSTPESAGGTSAARALNTAQGATPSPVPLVPPLNYGSPAIKSHSIQHPDGTVITQQFHKPEEGVLKNKTQDPSKTNTQNPMPEIKVINGMHHVPFKSSDGNIKYVNAKGEIS